MSDAPSHSPQDALSAEKESGRFEVDTTPPQILELKASVQGGKVYQYQATDSLSGMKRAEYQLDHSEQQIHVQFRAADDFSPIKRTEYSLDAGEWHFVEPVGQLSDSKTESYDFSLSVAADASSQEHVVVVRAYDRYDNMNSAKTLVPGK